jgi:hypothetical protein
MFSEEGKMNSPVVGTAQMGSNATGPAGSKKPRSPKPAQVATGSVPVGGPIRVYPSGSPISFFRNVLFKLKRKIS